jgi:hypothetical protein
MRASSGKTIYLNNIAFASIKKQFFLLNLCLLCCHEINPHWSLIFFPPTFPPFLTPTHSFSKSQLTMWNIILRQHSSLVRTHFRFYLLPVPCTLDHIFHSFLLSHSLLPWYHETSFSPSLFLKFFCNLCWWKIIRAKVLHVEAIWVSLHMFIISMSPHIKHKHIHTRSNSWVHACQPLFPLNM